MYIIKEKTDVPKEFNKLVKILNDEFVLDIYFGKWKEFESKNNGLLLVFSYIPSGLITEIKQIFKENDFDKSFNLKKIERCKYDVTSGNGNYKSVFIPIV
jgi:hypothetical protein